MPGEGITVEKSAKETMEFLKQKQIPLGALLLFMCSTYCTFNLVQASSTNNIAT